MNRNQFTFYRSYYEALKVLPKKEQAAVVMAICAYALDEEEPKLEGTSHAIFMLVRPTLDAGRRKAAGGSKGTPKKDTGKIKERCGKDTAKEKEKEKEKEGEIEKENECSSPLPLLPGAGKDLQNTFSEWLSYKQERKEGYKPTGLKALQTEVMNNARKHGEESVSRLIRHCMANGWKGIIFELLVKDGGRFKQTVLFDDSERKPQGGDFLAFLAESGVEV